MPEQTTVSKPSLYGGISTQPPHLRHPSQVADATNADFSPAFGMYKRAGTKLVADLGTCRITVGSYSSGTPSVGDTVTRTSGSPSFAGVIVSMSADSLHLNIKVTSGTFTATGVTFAGSGARTATITTVWSQWTTGTKLRLHPIYRSESEVYLTIHGPSDYPRVIPISSTPGREAILSDGSGSHAVRTYLASGSALAKDYRYCTIGDVTYIANTKKKMGGVNWASTESAGEQGTITASTMPQKMTRTSLSPLTFSFAAETWQDRYIVASSTGRGNNASNPLPALIGGYPYTTTITTASEGEYPSDIGVFKSRFYITGGPYALFSQTNDFTDFWYDVPTSVVDSDPVQVRVSDSAVAAIDRATPLQNAMVVSTGSNLQFELSSTSDIFGPSSARAATSTTINTIPSIALPRFQTGVLLPSKNRESGALYYYVYDDSQITYTAIPFTSHVEGLLYQNITRVVADTNTGFVGIITSDDTNTMYVMRMAYEGGRPVQSAWTKWMFGGDNDALLDAAIMNGTVYLVLESNGTFLVEGLALGSPMTIGSDLLLSGSTFSGSGESGAASA